MEQNLRKCKQCNTEKLRILSGNFPNKKDKKWVDPSGALWNGNLCPACHKENVAEKMRESRAKNKSI